jgi:hypothetical protein
MLAIYFITETVYGRELKNRRDLTYLTVCLVLSVANSSSVVFRGGDDDDLDRSFSFAKIL